MSEFNTVQIKTDDGLTLYGRDYGIPDSGHVPVVCLPGLSRNSRDFHQFAMKLALAGRRAITLDYRGRGLSNWDAKPENYNILREAQDVVLALDALHIENAAFVGTSRGGLILHILGAMIPDRIEAIVFNDIGPVIERDGLKRIRDYLSKSVNVSDLDEAAGHLKAMHGPEFPIFSDADWRDMAEAIYREIDGRLVADFDPALVEPLKSMDFDKPLADLWPQFEALKPIALLVVRGENSKLLSLSTVDEMLSKHPNALAITAEGQGHAPILHLDGVYERIFTFLSRG